jgi:hypothetical protein
VVAGDKAGSSSPPYRFLKNTIFEFWVRTRDPTRLRPRRSGALQNGAKSNPQVSVGTRSVASVTVGLTVSGGRFQVRIPVD